MTDSRIRLVGWNVQPVVMIDDGDNLIPTQIAPQLILAVAWQAFKDGGDTHVIDGLRAQLAASPPDNGLRPAERPGDRRIGSETENG